MTTSATSKGNRSTELDTSMARSVCLSISFWLRRFFFCAIVCLRYRIAVAFVPFVCRRAMFDIHWVLLRAQTECERMSRLRFVEQIECAKWLFSTCGDQTNKMNSRFFLIFVHSPELCSVFQLLSLVLMFDRLHYQLSLAGQQMWPKNQFDFNGQRENQFH